MWKTLFQPLLHDAIFISCDLGNLVKERVPFCCWRWFNNKHNSPLSVLWTEGSMDSWLGRHLILPEEESGDALARLLLSKYLVLSVSISLDIAGSGAEFPHGLSEDRGLCFSGNPFSRAPFPSEAETWFLEGAAQLLKDAQTLLMQIQLQRRREKVTHSSIKVLAFTFCPKLSYDAQQHGKHSFALIRMPVDGALPSAHAAGSYT